MAQLDAAVTPKSQSDAPPEQPDALAEARLDSPPRLQQEATSRGLTVTDVPNDEAKNKGLVQMEPGHDSTPDRYTYNPSQRNDRLLSMEEGKTADGTLTVKKFGTKADGVEPRADGMTEESTLVGQNKSNVTRKFDSAVNPQGMSGETVVTDGKTTTTTREFDPASANNKNGLKSEVVASDGKGGETTTTILKDGSRVERVKADGKEVSAKKFDKDGKEIKEDAAPKPDDKTKSIDDQLKDYRAELEKGNELPPIKRGKGPYDSVEEAVKKGSLKLSHDEILSEARRIRDRDFKEKGRNYYKEGEKLERYTQKEIDEKVAAKRAELEKAQPKEQPPAEPKQPDAEGEGDKPAKPSESDGEKEPKPSKPADSEGDKPAKPAETEGDKPAKPAETKLDVANNGASPEFQAKVQSAVDALPDGVKKLLQEKGVSVAVAKEDPNGFFSPFSRNKSEDGTKTTLSIAENVDRGIGGPMKTDDIDVRNAVAFAVQHTSDPPMDKAPEFQNSIKADLAKMTDESLKERVTKMLETPSGQEQLFHKLFAERYMSGDAHAQDIQKLFPEASKWLDGRINGKTADQVTEPVEAPKVEEMPEAKEKRVQAERLTPSADTIKQAMTPEVEAELKKHGLETDPEKLKQGITDAIRSDSMPIGVMQKRGDGDFPVMAGYMATGLLNAEQRQEILDDQKAKRAKWREENPDAEKGAEFKQFQVGQLLRERFGKERVDAADALLKKLQPAKPAK